MPKSPDPVTVQSHPALPVDAGYSAEIRFGVVMYGGVSLAIYINGVTNEMFEMACATPRDGHLLENTGATATREIYRRLSWLTGEPELRREYARLIADARRAAANARVDGHAAAEPVVAADPWPQLDLSAATRTRLVVDVVAGTSAGGINGIFLAKALANGEQFAALQELWVNEGDIGLLLNDAPSYRGVEPPLTPRSGPPASLLNSDRMYAKLLAAMQAMKPLPRLGPAADGSPLVDEVDLYVTTTDIEGSAVPLRLFDKVVFERRYKQNYRFSFPNGVSAGGNDFAAVNTAFLAFAARCTSSFPFAFEPMTLATVARLKADGEAPGLARWRDFFPNLPRVEVAQDLHVHRAFGDGGYLDNKPFTYVVEALSQRFASVPIERKLVFVEPSPEQIDPHRTPDPGRTPDALQNSLAALTSIPRYESIREDLQSVLSRNRRIERVERMVRLGEVDIERQADPFAGLLKKYGPIPPWASLKLSEMADYYGLAFLPYHRLRVYAVTDSLADRLGWRWGIHSGSDLHYGLRALVRVWRDRGFNEQGEGGRETFNAFLDQFDFDYRIRRLGFLLRRIDQLTRLLRKRGAGSVDTAAGTVHKPAELSDSDRQIIARLPEPFTGLREDLGATETATGLQVLKWLKTELIEVRSQMQQARRALDASLIKDATDPTLREELRKVLLLVLGEVPTGQKLQLSGAAGDQRVNVVLNPEALRMASSTRTLQEGVMFRAKALFDAAETVAPTPLHKALVTDLELMRLKRGAATPDAGHPTINALALHAWMLLGGPQLKLDESLGRVRVTVGDTPAAKAGPGMLEAINSPAGHALRGYLGESYLRFDSYDQMSFPLYYDTGTGEPSTVEVVRISPADATQLIDEASDALGRRKLAGTAIANFGAFLDRRWRLNDILWGRLDGAERLIQALLPMADEETQLVRHELIERAHRAILREALVPAGQRDLADLLVKALAEVPGGDSPPQRLNQLLQDLWGGNAVARDKLGAVLVSLLSEPGLVDYVRQIRRVDPEPDPEATLANAARAITITGRVLEGISKGRGRQAPVSRWLARLGLLLQGVVAVALPGTLKNRLWTHALKLLYAFEIFAIVLALVWGGEGLRSAAVTAFGVTLGVHLLTLVAGDVMRERKRWLRIVVMAFVGVLVALAAVGGLTIFHQGTQQVMCWSRPDAGSSGPTAEAPGGGLARTVCAWLSGR